VGITDVDDSLLVRRAKRGDQNAVDALLRLHYESVRAVCHRIVINRSDAEDATQMALISIVRALPSFDGRSKFSTWVYRIATNAALDEVRRIGRRPIPTEKESVYDSPTIDQTSAVDAQMDVSGALAQLPEEYRTAIVLRHVADLDYEEIAAIQGVPIGTVRSRLARGRAQLAEILGNQNAHSDRQIKTTTTPPEGNAP
jgi:RNA polymerase sigma-70 factor (ECF subfamily)